MNTAKLVIAGEEMDLKQALGFGLNYSIDDVRKVEKKNSNYSKTITLVGSRTVNRLMGGLFDINADFTFFNPNIKTDAKIIVNSSTVIEGSMQLKSIDLINPSAVNTEAVEYKCVIVSNSIDFMGEIKGKLLNELDLGGLDHDLNITNVENSWSNTEDYVYPLFWKSAGGGNNNYNIEDFKPAIFYKTYLKKIAEQAGYTISGSLMDDTTEEGASLAKEIIPFSGILPLITEAEYTRRRFRASPLALTQFENSTLPAASMLSSANQQTRIDGDLQVFTDDNTGLNFDNGGVFDTVNSQYTIDAKGNYGLFFQVNAKMTFSTASIEAWQAKAAKPWGSSSVTVTPNTQPNDYTIIFRLTKNGVPFGASTTATFTTPIGAGVASTFNAGNGYSISENVTAALSIPSGNFSANDVIGVTYSVRSFRYQTKYALLDSYTTGVREVNTLTAVDLDWKVEAEISNTFLYNAPNASALKQGDPVIMSSFIPEKIKQTDLINDLVKRYNAYLSIDPDNDHKIILDTRDAYYAKGSILDWTDLKDKGSKDTIKLLSELQNKEILFTYKKGSDVYNEAYFNATEQNYGQKKIAFLNDFAKGEKKIESVFTPTVLINNANTLPAAIVSAWDTDVVLNKGFTTMYYDGLIPTIENRQFAVIYEDAFGVPTSSGYTTYPYAGHLDNPYQPNIDLNFGETAYSTYTLQTNTTDATLYNRYWKNYINQIDDGKLVTMKLKLNEVIIDYIRKNLNAKVWIENSYYFINNIIDYDPVNDNLTKVEMLKVKDGVPFFGRSTVKDTQAFINNDPELRGASTGDSTNSNDSKTSTVSSGEGNVIEEGAESAFIAGGDNNTILAGTTGGFIIGASDKTITEDNEGWIGEVHYLDGAVLASTNYMTLAELLTLRNAGGLVSGNEYLATDKNYIFKALSDSELDFNGVRVLKVLNSELYASQDIFDPLVSYSISDRSIWGGRIWDCKAAGTSTPTDYLTLNPANWELSIDLADYDFKSFDIKYNEFLTVITEQSDDRGNVVFASDGLGITGFTSNDGFDFSDWNNPTIKNNRCSIFINNISTEIENNNCFGIVNNKTESVINRNNINGNIAYNVSTLANTLSIKNNINNGNINYNTCSSNIKIEENDNNGSIGTSPSTFRASNVLGTTVNL